MRAYIITLRHAGGRIAVRVTASSQAAAIRQALDWEGAPESAIVSVRTVRRVLSCA